MKEFFQQCLEELEDVTGIRQLHWLRQACDDQSAFDKRKKILIDSMVTVCLQFPYIPEKAQQKVIRKMMIEDQQYEGLNSRTIHKWLTLASNSYRTHSQFNEDDLTPRDSEGKPTDPAPPEVAEKYIEQLKEIIANTGRKVPQVSEEEIQAEGKIRDPQIAKLKEQIGTGGINPRPKFVIEGVEIQASSKEEAQKAYNATFL